MVNGFMEKRQYIIPQMEVTAFNTALMSLTDSASVLPGPGSQAPARKADVF